MCGDGWPARRSERLWKALFSTSQKLRVILEKTSRTTYPNRSRVADCLGDYIRNVHGEQHPIRRKRMARMSAIGPPDQIDLNELTGLARKDASDTAGFSNN